MLLFGITGSINHGKTSLAGALANQAPNRSKHYTSFEIIALVADALNLKTIAVPNPKNISEINEWLKPLPEILEQQLSRRCSFAKLKLKDDDIKKNQKDYQKLFAYLKLLKATPSLSGEKITQTNKETFRPLLQWLGGYLHNKVDPNIWFAEMIKRSKQDKLDGILVCTIDGVRYPNEAALIRRNHGHVLLVKRPGLGRADSTDPTEAQQDQVKPDITIINNGKLSDLDDIARHLVRDAKFTKLKTSYQTD